MPPALTRDWSDVDRAIDRGELEERCIYCGRTFRLERAHVTPRDRDGRDEHGRRHSRIVKVNPLDIVFLCGPQVDTGTCHNLFDTGQIDLLPRMIDRCPEKITRAVERMGLEKARTRLFPSDYAPVIQAARHEAIVEKMAAAA